MNVILVDQYYQNAKIVYRHLISNIIINFFFFEKNVNKKKIKKKIFINYSQILSNVLNILQHRKHVFLCKINYLSVNSLFHES